MTKIEIEPIGHVFCDVSRARDEHWGSVIAEIRLDSNQFQAVALEGLQEFSHVEVFFHFNQLGESEVEKRTRHPRENPKWPKVGIFAQRGRRRPNRVGATICEIISIDGMCVRVRGLDAFHGSPVIDIKPVMAEFLPDKAAVREPQWARELMTTYF